jgi:hypothetical protein
VLNELRSLDDHAQSFIKMLPVKAKTAAGQVRFRAESAEELRAMTRDQLAKYARVIKEMGTAAE